MRQFFLDLLQELQKLTGIKQYENMNLESDEGKKDLGELLDILVRTCETFPLIPKDAQKSILRHAVISDGDFIGLNAKFVYKSLQAHRDRFFKEAAHMPTQEPEGYKPLEGEARQAKLKEWMSKLQEFGEKATTQSHVQELVAKLPPKEKGLNYPSTRAEDVLKRELHIEYLKAMSSSGVPKEEWEPEEDWIKSQK
jgi:hypothetical protein